MLERIGLPAAVVCTDAFEGSVNAMAAIQGFPGYRYVAVPHPVASRTGEELEEMSKRFVDEVAVLLGIVAAVGREERGQVNVGDR